MSKIASILTILSFSLLCTFGVAQEAPVTQVPAQTVEEPASEEVSPSETVPVQEAPEDIAVETTQDDVEEDENLISINFQNVNINEIIKVLEDITGKVIISTQNLKGQITIVGSEKMKLEDVVKVLESALMVKGYTIVETEQTIRIIPLPESKQTNVAVRVGSWSNQIREQDVVITQVMPLQYSSALKLKTTLQPLLGKHGNLIANERTNTLIVTDLSSNIKRLAMIIEQMEHPSPAELQVKTFVLNYGDSEAVAKILNDLSEDDSKTPHSYPGTVIADQKYLEIYGRIQAIADKETNSIVVASAPINFPSIEQLIRDLDIFPPQVMIEVVIMDVRLDDDFTMGVEWADATAPTLTTEGYKGDINNRGINESIFHSFLGLATDAATAGFTYRILNAKQSVQALGFILSSVENSKVLSTPKILASNNTESSITVAQEIPIIESSVTDLSNNVTNVDFRYQDVGIILKVTPRISRDGYVNMNIHAELSDLSAQTIQNASIINKREADATVMLPDNHSVILGGLIRDNNSAVEKKIPFLGDLPIVGVLFKKTTTAMLRSELIIFLTPHILKNTEELKAISKKPNDKLDLIKTAKTSRELKEAVSTVVEYDAPEEEKSLQPKEK